MKNATTSGPHWTSPPSTTPYLSLAGNIVLSGKSFVPPPTPYVFSPFLLVVPNAPKHTYITGLHHETASASLFLLPFPSLHSSSSNFAFFIGKWRWKKAKHSRGKKEEEEADSNLRGKIRDSTYLCCFSDTHTNRHTDTQKTKVKECEAEAIFERPLKIGKALLAVYIQ